MEAASSIDFPGGSAASPLTLQPLEAIGPLVRRVHAILSPRPDELNIAPRRDGQAACWFARASRFSHGCDVMAQSNRGLMSRIEGAHEVLLSWDPLKGEGLHADD